VREGNGYIGDIYREFNPETTTGERARRATVDSIRSGTKKQKKICLHVPGGSRPQQITPQGAGAALRSGTNPRRSRGNRARANPIARGPDRRTRRKKKSGRAEEGGKIQQQKIRNEIYGARRGDGGNVGETHRNRAAAAAGG